MQNWSRELDKIELDKWGSSFLHNKKHPVKFLTDLHIFSCCLKKYREIDWIKSPREVGCNLVYVVWPGHAVRRPLILGTAAETIEFNEPFTGKMEKFCPTLPQMKEVDLVSRELCLSGRSTRKCLTLASDLPKLQKWKTVELVMEMKSREISFLTYEVDLILTFLELEKRTKASHEVVFSFRLANRSSPMDTSVKNSR